MLAGISGVRFQLAESSSEIDADELMHSRRSAHRRAGSSGAAVATDVANVRSGGSSAPSSPGAALLRSRGVDPSGSLRVGTEGGPLGASVLGPDSGSGLPPRQPEPSASRPSSGGVPPRVPPERSGAGGSPGAAEAGAEGADPGSGGGGGGSAAAARLVERPGLRPGPGTDGGWSGAAAAAAAR